MKARLSSALVMAIVGLTACARTIETRRPMPVGSEPPKAEVSRLTVPVSTSLATIRDAVENGVEQSYGAARYNLSDCNNRGCGADPPACLWNAGYGVTRSPFNINGSQNTVVLGTELRYWLAGRARFPCPGPLINGSCGDENNANDRRRINTSISLSLKIKDDWTTEVRAGAPDVQPLDQCSVGPFGVKNLTDKVAEAVRNRLSAAGDGIARKLNEQLDLRNRVTAAWAEMLEPVSAGLDTWLVLNADGLEASQPAITGNDFGLRAGLVARPVIVIGPRPAPANTNLPTRTDPGAENSFAIHLPAQIDYATIRNALRAKLGIPANTVRVPPKGKYYVMPADVDVQGYGGQMIVAIPFKGKGPGWLFSRKLKGTVYLSGTPTYDQRSGIISFPDLDFAAETRNALLKSLAFIKHDEWLAQLQGQLTFDIKSQVDAARTALFRALNRETATLKMEGVIDQFAFEGIWSDPSARLLRAVGRAVGNVSVTLKRVAGQANGQ